MRSVHLVILSILTLILLSCTGCFSYSIDPPVSYPVYERMDSKEDGITVNFEGVIYKMYPLAKWEVRPDGKLLGYAGTKDTIICLAQGDTERNFIFVQDNGASMYSRPLYRTDREIPDPSGESVDIITWKEFKTTGETPESNQPKCINKDTIKRLFDVWDIGEKTWEYKLIPAVRIDVVCSSSQVPGAYFGLFVVMNSNNELMMGTPDQGFTKVPIELLEEISGHDIDMDAWSDQEEAARIIR